MNILFTNSVPFNPTLGGIERVTDTIARELISRGYGVLFLSSTWQGGLECDFAAEQLVMPSGELYATDEDVMFYGCVLRDYEIDIVVNQRGSYSFGDFVRETSGADVRIISVIHSKPLLNLSSLKYSFCASLRNSLRGSGVDLRVRVENIVKLLSYPLSLWMVKKLRMNELQRHYNDVFRYSDRVILLSDRFREELSLAHSGDKDRVVAIPNINSFEPQEINFDDKKRQVLFVGRFTYYAKRVDRLLRAWAIIQARNPDWELLLVGGGEQELSLRRQVEKHKIERVQFAGYQSNTQHYYHNASIFCMTSSFEGFPMVLTEAMTFGCVPIAFESYESVNDIVDHGINGVLVEPFNVERYALELEALMRDDQKRLAMAKQAQRKAREFSAEAVVRRWEELFESVLAAR